MILATLNIDDLQQTVVLIVIERDNLERMKKADPITLESVNNRGLLEVPRYPNNLNLLIAYEEDEVELYRLARQGGPGLLLYLERGRKWREAEDGTKNAVHLSRVWGAPDVIVEQGIVMPDAEYRLIRVGSALHRNGKRMAIVDASDYPALWWRSWTLRRGDAGNLYASTTYQGRTVDMHRLILAVTDPQVYVDHLDGFGLNNRRYNLAPGTPAANLKTRKRWKVERSRVTGRYEVAIYAPDGSRSVVGEYDSYSAAHEERWGKKAYWEDFPQG